MPSSKYEAQSIHAVEPRSFYERFSKVSIAVAKTFTNCKSDYSAMLATLRRGAVCSRLEHLNLAVFETIKTHKNPGEVVPRVLHSGCNFPFQELGAWLSHVLRVKLQNLPHLVKDTNAAVAMLKTVKLEDSDLLVTADVSDFFMSGTHVRLAKNAGSLFSGPRRDAVDRASSFLLDSQYVLLQRDQRTITKVITGAGMGVNFSSELSDAAFYVQNEVPFVLAPAHSAAVGVKLYMRFRDDLFFVLRRAPERASIGREWLRVCPDSDFKLEKWAASRWRVTFLDLEITANHTSGRLDFRPFVKPTSLGIPLSDTSAHAPTVHLSWPLAYARRLSLCSSTSSAFGDAKSVFVRRLRRHLANERVVAAVSQWKPSLRPTTTRADPARDSVFWVPLPYHPLWARTKLDRFLHDFFSSPAIVGLWALANSAHRPGPPPRFPTLRIAWSNGAKPLGMWLRALQADGNSARSSAR